MKNKAFTLTEIFIIVTLISIFFVGVIVAINPLSIINRGYDASRKKDLDDAKKMLEQYMADTGCYPLPTQICIEGNNNSNCHICTKKQLPKAFSYFTKDICDPKSGQMDYLYQTETTLVPKVGNIVNACPKWFRMFTVLDGVYNRAEDVYGCGIGGCGVGPYYGYSYLVTSPGAPVDPIGTTNWYCLLTEEKRCVQCSPYENCILPSNDCYNKDLYPTRQNCCSKNGISPCN